MSTTPAVASDESPADIAMAHPLISATEFSSRYPSDRRFRSSTDGDGVGGRPGFAFSGPGVRPLRDSAEVVEAVLGWATHKGITVFGIEDEIRRLNCAALPVTAEERGLIAFQTVICPSSAGAPVSPAVSFCSLILAS